MAKQTEIFSGEYSADMWIAINSAKTKGDLRRALFFVCCRLQELEAQLNRGVEPQITTLSGLVERTQMTSPPVGIPRPPTPEADHA